MRVSSSTLFESNVAAMNQEQSRLLQLQQQVSTGRRIQSASDDPVAAARALEISQADAVNTQHASNLDAANHTLSLAETALQGVTSLLQDVSTTILSAGNGSLTDASRRSMASELSGRLQQLMGLANSDDGAGNYLFAGFQTRTQPFADVSGTVVYNGDDGQRKMQVSSSRQMSSSDSGADVFMRIKNGNGTFLTQAAAANTGSGIVSVGSVTDPTLVTNHNYQIDFSVALGVTTYSVTDTTTAAVISAGNPFVSGQAISFDGMQFDIQGAPADLDSFTVAPSTNESIFKTISGLITALNTPVPSGGMPALSNILNHGARQLDNALNNVLATRATLGFRLGEVDAIKTAGQDLNLQLKQALSKLQDVDYNQAISELVQQHTNLKAAQETFSKVAGLSLFDFIN
jgi:flagellar hook-associated protein 3 FlgL